MKKSKNPKSKYYRTREYYRSKDFNELSEKDKKYAIEGYVKAYMNVLNDAEKNHHNRIMKGITLKGD